MTHHINTLIIGAGISGLGTAVHMQKQSPNRKFLILERRDRMGGTWSLFKYPGIRSDSDMSTFGFAFKPWREDKVLAQADEICNYLEETIREFDLADKIKYNHGVKSANWNSAKQVWEIQVDNNGHTEEWTANFVVGCTGYYNYEQGFQPDFPDLKKFKGQFIHPQQWPENVEYKDKKVVIIGSGATAITLVPALAKLGAIVTMLQRTPTYIATVPSVDFAYNAMRKILPDSVAYNLTRKRNIALQRGIYALSRSKPEIAKKLLLSGVKHQLKGKVDMKHFTPPYNPWDQRLCVVPDGDLFKTLREGKAFIETDQIEKFVANGIQLKSGKVLEADIVVSATGLEIQLLGGLKATIDGQAIETSEQLMYHGTMISNVPNFALIIGYTNASWTLKVDIIADYLCRLFNHMDKNGYGVVVAQGDDSAKSEDTMMGSLSSGYVQRAAHLIPRQGTKAPWVLRSSYYDDRNALAKASFKDGILKFSKAINEQAKPKKRLKIFS